jgi:uncharacterized protein
MQTFDDLAVRRLPLARSYLQLLAAQPGRPIALFAPRRVGKTYFLAHDLKPEAARSGYLPVYADVWLHKREPLSAINHALEEALDDATVPKTEIGKVGKTRVTKIGGFGASLEIGDEPKRRVLPDAPELRLDALVTRLASAGGKRVLLMLDEIQALGEAPDGSAIVATLRAVLQNRQDIVAAVFTGSSQDALAAMMVVSGGPMYQFAQMLDFPALGDEYLAMLQDHYNRVHPAKRLDAAALRRAFDALGRQPALMKDLVKGMSADGLTDVDSALRRLSLDEKQVAGWRVLLAGLSPLERAVLILLARGQLPMSRDTMAQLAALPLGTQPTIAKVRAALDRMQRSGLLAKRAGAYQVEDPLLAANLRRSDTQK